MSSKDLVIAMLQSYFKSELKNKVIFEQNAIVIKLKHRHKAMILVN